MSDFTQFLFRSAQELRGARAAFVGFHWPMVVDRVARRLGWYELEECVYRGEAVTLMVRQLPPAGNHAGPA